MKFYAKVKNQLNQHYVEVNSNSETKVLNIPGKSGGFGSGINGGELLLVALATCYCNDIYREAGKLNLKVDKVEVIASADFDAPGEPGRNFQYLVKVASDHNEKEIRQLLAHTDEVAEIQNTLRQGVTVNFQITG